MRINFVFLSLKISFSLVFEPLRDRNEKSKATMMSETFGRNCESYFKIGVLVQPFEEELLEVFKQLSAAVSSQNGRRKSENRGANQRSADWISLQKESHCFTFSEGVQFG